MIDTPSETFALVSAMVDELLKVDPNYKLILEEPLEIEQYPEWQHIEPTGHDVKHFRHEFDDEMQDRFALLVDYKQYAERTLAASVREVLGLSINTMSDEQAIRLVLDPSQNTILGETMVLTSQSKLSRAMHNVHYTFRKKLSHAADSQDQRHRMTPGSRPILHRQLDPATPDYITPLVVLKAQEAAKDQFHLSIRKTWDSYAKLLEMGVNQEFAEYLLPNATTVRFTESADLLSLHHKHDMRL